uniref:Mitochondrial carrier protein n=1 Tax=Amphora coffeiformis TaxID=265554 RepID=A0A7S3LBY1_9STRA
MNLVMLVHTAFPFRPVSSEVIVGHPLDLIKVRMQMTGGTGNASVTGLLQKTFHGEGVAGLFRGVSAPLFAVTPLFAVGFWAYDIGQRGIRQYYNYAHNKELSMAQICLAGGFSAIPTTVLMTPTERLKVMMQVNAGRYSSLIDCAKQVHNEGGLRSLYRGTALTLWRDIPGNIAWFGTYEICKPLFTRWLSTPGTDTKKEKSTVAILTAGGVAGMACWAVCIPFDVLKSRQQAAPQSLTALQVLKDLLRTEGWPALFRGLRPAMVRAFPANAACFYGMEMTRDALSFLDG